MSDSREKEWRLAIPQLGSAHFPNRDDALEHADHWRKQGFWVVIRRWNGKTWDATDRLAPTNE